MDNVTGRSGNMQVDDRDLLQGLAFVFLAVLFYCAVHIGFRLLASDVLGEDDIIDTILVQDLLFGYDAFPRQPPLYDWVLWCVQQVTGPSIVGFLFIKYLALIVTACVLYLVSYRVLKDRWFAILSVESLALIYQISWRYHEGYTHEVGAMVAVMVTAWLFLRLLRYCRFLDFVLLGVAVGFGLLTEPAFGVFFLSLIGAGALQRSIRARVFRPAFVVTLVLAVTIASPYALWLLSKPYRIHALFRTANNFSSEALKGLVDALRAPIAYLSPLLFILPMVFPRFVFVAWQDLKRKPNTHKDPDLRQLFLHSSLVAFGFSIIGALGFAIHGQPVHVFMPLYLVSVVWLFSVAQRAADGDHRVRFFGRLALAIAFIALLVRLANMFVLDPVCHKCRWGIPYQALAHEMRDRGFDKGLIISVDRELAGNLRQLFPASKFVMRRYPEFTPQNVDYTSGKVAFVWGTQLSDKTVNQYLKSFLPPGHSFKEAELLSIPWHHIYKPKGYRISEWKLLIIDMDKEHWNGPKG